MTIRLPDPQDTYERRRQIELQRILEQKFDQIDAALLALQAVPVVITVPAASLALTTTAPSVVVA